MKQELPADAFTSKGGTPTFPLSAILALMLLFAMAPLTARAMDAELIGFGRNSESQVDLPPLPPGVNYTQIVGGGFHTLALRSDGLVDSSVPVLTDVPDPPPGVVYTQVAAGEHHCLRLRSDGQIAAVGWHNPQGQTNVPPLPPGVVYTYIAAGWLHSLAIRSDGELVAFGLNDFGQCDVQNLPILPPGVFYTQVAAGWHHSIALRSDGQLVAFGANGNGQLGVPALPPGTFYTQIACGHSHSLALRSDGWGIPFGLSGNRLWEIPTLPPGLVYTQVDCGAYANLVLRSDGRIFAWGFNQYQQNDVPGLPAGTVYTQIAKGHFHSLAIARTFAAVTLNGDDAVYLLPGETFSDPGAIGTDEEGNNLPVTTTGSVDVNTVGRYTLIYTATAPSGHTALATRSVSVVNKLPTDLSVAMMPSHSQHPTYGNAAVNEPINVWGRAWGGTPPYTVELDFGDGTPPLVGGASPTSASFIGVLHTYTSPGPKTATLTATDSVGTIYSRQAVIQVLDTPTHEERVSMAIEKGLLRNYWDQDDLDENRITWGAHLWNKTFVEQLGAAMMAFQENGHLAKNDYEEDIYAETVQKGLNTILDCTQGYRYVLFPHSDGIEERYSDSNGNGTGAYLTSDTLASACASMALILAHDSFEEANKDIVLRGPFQGMSYSELVEDLLDQYSHAQGDGIHRGEDQRGGWHERINTHNYYAFTGDAMRWPSFVFETARERWGLAPEPWVTDNAVHRYQQLQHANGGIGSVNLNWLNIVRTGGALVGFSAGSKAVGDDNVDRALSFIGSIWYNAPYIQHPIEGGWSGEFDAMFALKKGLQFQGVDMVNTPFGTHDWYQDMSAWLLGDASLLDPALNPSYRHHGYGFGQILDPGQRWDGTWVSNDNKGRASKGVRPTSYAILILTRHVTVLNQPPTVELPPAASFECDSELTITAALNDPDDDPLTVIWMVDNVVYAVHSLPGGADSDSITDTFGYGTHDIEIAVTDNKSAAVLTDTSVLIADIQPPAIACPDDLTVQCNTPTDPGATGFATAADNCDPTPFISFMDTVTPGACPNTEVITRTWTATDSRGNSAACVQTIEVVDQIAPLATAPPDLTVICGIVPVPAATLAEFLTLGGTATDNCDASPTLTSSDSGADECPTVLTRTYTISDACGNSTATQQIINVITAAQAVEQCVLMVVASSAGQEDKTPLIEALNQAMRKFEMGQFDHGVKKLEDFLKKLENRVSDGSIDPATGDELTDCAQSVIDAVSD